MKEFDSTPTSTVIERSKNSCGPKDSVVVAEHCADSSASGAGTPATNSEYSNIAGEDRSSNSSSGNSRSTQDDRCYQGNDPASAASDAHRGANSQIQSRPTGSGVISVTEICSHNGTHVCSDTASPGPRAAEQLELESGCNGVAKAQGTDSSEAGNCGNECGGETLVATINRDPEENTGDHVQHSGTACRPASDGSKESLPCPSQQLVDHSVGDGNLEVGSLRGETFLQVHGSSGFSCALVDTPKLEVDAVSTTVQIDQTVLSTLDPVFNPTRSDHSTGVDVRTRHNPEVNWAHTGTGELPSVENIHRCESPPSGICNSTTDGRKPVLCNDGSAGSVQNLLMLYDISRPIDFEALELKLAEEPSVVPCQVAFELLPSSSTGFDLVTYIDGIRTNIRIPRTRCELPVASIAAPLFDYNNLKSLFAELPPPDELITMMNWLTTDSLAELLEQHPDLDALIQNQRHNLSRSASLYEACPLLLELGTFSQRTSPRGLLQTVFLVPKADNLGSRVIMDCKPINVLIRNVVPVPKAPIPEINEVNERILRHRFFCQIDAKSMFYQFGITSKRMRRFLQFRCGGTRGHFYHLEMCVGAMGLTFMPAFGQYLSNYLCDVTLMRAEKAGFSLDSVDTIPWQDNYMLCADDEATLHALREIFCGVCATVNLVLKDSTPIGTSGTALGIYYDLVAGTIRPSDRLLERLSDSFAACLKPTATHMSFLKWFGSALWINWSVAHMPLCAVRETMEQLRNIARLGDFTCKLSLSDNVRSEITRLNAFLSQCSGSSHRETIDENVLSTDASSTWGIGAYLESDQCPIMAAKQMTINPRRIFLAELMAGIMFAEHFKLHGKPYTWITDNTSGARAMIKGHSTNAEADKLLVQAFQHNLLPAEVKWVPTACMRADPMSRGEMVPGPQCTHIHLSSRRRCQRGREGSLCV